MYMNTDTFDLYPTINCASFRGPAVEIDEPLAPTLQLLNQKGYHTVYSCSGHVAVETNADGKKDFNEAYIVFLFSAEEKPIADYIAQHMPSEFTIDDDKSDFAYVVTIDRTGKDLQEALKTVYPVNDNPISLGIRRPVKEIDIGNDQNVVTFSRLLDIQSISTALYSWAKDLPKAETLLEKEEDNKND